MKQLHITSIRRWGILALVGLAVTAGATSYAQSAQTTTASMGIVLVDRNAFFIESLAGQDINRQVQDMRKGIEDDLTKKADQLRTAEEQLSGQQGVLTQDAFEARAKTLRQQRLSLQREADEKSRQLQAGILKAQNTVWQNASPILDDLLKESKATLMLERSAVVKGSVDLDVTATALQRLNSKLPKVKVELVDVKQPGQ